VLQAGPVKVTDRTSESWVFSCPDWRLALHGQHGRVACITGGHRQQNDSEFQALLDRVRWGRQSLADVATINETWDTFVPPAGVNEADVTKLRILKMAVANINQMRLEAINEPLFTFPADVVVVTTDAVARRQALKDLGDFIDNNFAAKMSSPVIFTRRVGRFPTGTRGHIVGFENADVELGSNGNQALARVVCEVEGERVEVVRERFSVYDSCGAELVFCYQMPLLLGWALTVHRAQGMTLDAVELDFGKDTWATCGLVYSALSRCRTLAGLRVTGLTSGLVQVSSMARKYMAKELMAAGRLDSNAAVWAPKV